VPQHHGLLAAYLALSGCTAADPNDDLVWAINLGGSAHMALDGTEYGAEVSVSGGRVGAMELVKGSQDPVLVLYRTFREGDIRVDHPIPDGVYDITFHFAEPLEIGGGERVFDGFAEEQRVIDNLDVMAFRDGQVFSGLTVTAPNVAVDDGELTIRFDASAGEPTLSALVVREKNRPAKDWQLVWSDEFDDDAIDSSKWTPDIWPPGKVNDEDQAYTGRKKNLRVEDGMLIIEAHREDYEGASYTSGRLHSEGSGDFLYGRFEVRAKLPRGQGSWAAIWMLPSDPYRYSTTCESGEDWQGSETCDAWPTRARSTSWSTSATRWVTSTARCTTRPTTGKSGSSARGVSCSATSTRHFTFMCWNGRPIVSTFSSTTRTTSRT
jgi:hypothetical protein